MFRRTTLVRAILFVAASYVSSPAQAQFFFEGDAVFYTRNNTGGTPFLGGPTSVSSSKGSYDIEPGYRLGFGWSGENLQVDTTFTQITPWTAESSGILSGNLYMNPNDPAIGPADHTLQYQGFLSQAAQSTLGGTTESGFLIGSVVPGDAPSYSTSTTSNYRDIEVNIGSSQYKRPWRLAVGYRNVQLDEKNVMSMNGIFGTDATGISDAALIDAGASSISGAGSGFMQTVPPTYLNYQVHGQSQNDMNGAQLVFGYRFYDGPWLTLEGTSKAGIYRNIVSGRVQETATASGFNDSVYQRTMTGQDSGAAFAGNLGLKAVVGITDYIDFVIGYEVLFLAGVGLGPDQAGGISSNAAGAAVYHVQHDGSLIANGGTIGLRIYW
ncbi:hypothetical protein SH661x_000187 [Planctomicrobium sp. SH661]|uniref:hypothetical protein n=1 Tax=Planctomicrobium sp. SH661 TaxID=3448124 RepID=UPI003F5C10BC